MGNGDRGTKEHDDSREGQPTIEHVLVTEFRKNNNEMQKKSIIDQDKL